MKYYQLESIGAYELPEWKDYCSTGGSRFKGFIGASKFRTGISVKDVYPGDPLDATIQLADDKPGLELPSYISNISGYLLIHKDIYSIIKNFNINNYEALSFTLLNHRNRVHSQDYIALNPLGVKDCLNYDLSEILYFDDNSIRGIEKMVLDKSKVDDNLDLFRIKESPRTYVFSERVVEKLNDFSATNFMFHEMQQG